MVLSTNDPESIEVATSFQESRLRIVERPDELAQSSTDLTELIQYVPTICEHDHILWTHVTSPLTSFEQYSKAIEEYFLALNNNFDSLMSVRQYKNYLWLVVDHTYSSSRRYIRLILTTRKTLF